MKKQRQTLSENKEKIPKKSLERYQKFTAEEKT